MSNEAYRAWLDSMPIDDVRRKIERLEQKLADARVLERLYAEHHADADPPAAQAAPAEQEPPSEGGGDVTPEWGTSEGT